MVVVQTGETMKQKDFQWRLNAIADEIGLDEFERIVVADLIGRIGPPETPDSPERDQLYIQLGALIQEKVSRWSR